MTDWPLPEKVVEDKQTNFCVAFNGEQDCYSMEYDIDTWNCKNLNCKNCSWQVLSNVLMIFVQAVPKQFIPKHNPTEEMLYIFIFVK